MMKEKSLENNLDSKNIKSTRTESVSSEKQGPLDTGFQQTQEESNKEYFFIRQMPTIAKITGALEMPKKSFLYRLLT
jgi:hypothetical protein